MKYWLFCLPLLVLLTVCPVSAAQTVTAFVGATLVDGNGGDPLADSVILVKGERIWKVGTAAKVKIPKKAVVVDVSGLWITPGLVDPHIHFFQSGGLYTRPDVVDLRGTRSYEEECEMVQARLDEWLVRYLASGVTAVVDVGGPFWNFHVRQRANESPLAPRVAVAGPLVSTVARPQLDLGDPPIMQVESPEQARELVRRQLEHKPDLIKIWFILPKSGDVEENLPIVRATIEQAHAAGVRVAVHATQLETARAAVEAGAEILVHSIDDKPVDRAFIDLLVERGTLLTTTLVVYEGYADVLSQSVHLNDVERRLGDPRVIGSWDEMATGAGEVDPAKIEARRQKLLTRSPMMSSNLKALWDAGVLVNAGTDAGNIGTLHGPAIHRELELMAEAGLTPGEILVAATRNAAMVFAADPPFGTVEPGKLADMLILEADPLADVAHMRRIHRVVLGGRVLDPAQILPASAEAVVQGQVEAYAARDIEAFLATYAEDAQLIRQVSGEIIAADREAMRPIYTELFEQSPELAITILRRTVSANLVIDQELVTGARGGKAVRAVAIYEVEDGLIQRVWFLPKE